jgi:hypothetical protein
MYHNFIHRNAQLHCDNNNNNNTSPTNTSPTTPDSSSYRCRSTVLPESWQFPTQLSVPSTTHNTQHSPTATQTAQFAPEMKVKCHWGQIVGCLNRIEWLVMIHNMQTPFCLPSERANNSSNFLQSPRQNVMQHLTIEIRYLVREFQRQGDACYTLRPHSYSLQHAVQAAILNDGSHCCILKQRAVHSRCSWLIETNITVTDIGTKEDRTGWQRETPSWFHKVKKHHVKLLRRRNGLYLTKSMDF